MLVLDLSLPLRISITCEGSWIEGEITSRVPTDKSSGCGGSFSILGVFSFGSDGLAFRELKRLPSLFAAITDRMPAWGYHSLRYPNSPSRGYLKFSFRVE